LTWSWVGQVVYGAAVAVVGAFLGATVVGVGWAYWPSYLVQAVLGAMTVRLLATLTGILVVGLALGQTGPAFLLSAAGFYMLGLISETVVVLGLFRETYTGLHRPDEARGSGE